MLFIKIFSPKRVNGLTKYHCNKNVDLCVEGYPSSGNSFAHNFIQKIYPHIKISSHYHNISNLKLAKINNIPTLFLIRAPEDAISSRIIRFRESVTISHLIEEYIKLFNYIKNNQDFFKDVLSFDDFINDPYTLTNKLNFDNINENIETLNKDEIKEKTLDDIKSFYKNKKMDPVKSGFPSEEKELLKNDIKAQIIRDPKYKIANELYKFFNSNKVEL